MNTNSQTPASISKWMPLWIGNIRRETIGQPLEFQAMYINLMMAAWERGGQLPDDEIQLRRISGADLDQWHEHRQAIANLFVPCEGAWSHNLLREELAKAEKISKRRKAAGAKGNDLRWAANREAKATTATLLAQIASDGAAY